MTDRDIDTVVRRAAETCVAIIRMRAHVEPLPGRWRVIAMLPGGHTVFGESDRSDISGLYDAVLECEYRWKRGHQDAVIQ